MSQRTFIVAIRVEDWPSRDTRDMAAFVEHVFDAYTQQLVGDALARDKGKLVDVTVWSSLSDLKADEEGHHLEDWVSE